LPVGRDVARRAHTGRGEGFSDVAWNDFRRLGAEFAGRLIDHARREEDGLLPLLELALDEETDVRLASEHAMRR
jgi:hypothetical protein